MKLMCYYCHTVVGGNYFILKYSWGLIHSFVNTNIKHNNTHSTSNAKSNRGLSLHTRTQKNSLSTYYIPQIKNINKNSNLISISKAL